MALVDFPLGRGNYHKWQTDKDSQLQVHLINYPPSQPNEIDMVSLCVTKKFTEISFYIYNPNSMEKFCQFCDAHEITLLPLEVFSKKIHFKSDQIESIKKTLFFIFAQIHPANCKSANLSDVLGEINYFATRSKEFDLSMQGDYHDRKFHKIRFLMKTGAIYSWTDLFSREGSCFKKITFSSTTTRSHYFTKGQIALGYTCHRVDLVSTRYKINRLWYENQLGFLQPFGQLGYDFVIEPQKSKIRISCDYQRPKLFVDLLKFLFDRLNFENRNQFEQLLDKVRVHVMNHAKNPH